MIPPKYLKGNQSDKQYINIKFLDKGGMGQVFLADDTISNSKVAIKILTISDNAEKKLLLEELKIACSLKHPNIVNTFYFDEFTNNGEYYLYSVMEYLEEGSLHDILANSTSIPDIKTAIGYLINLAEGLAYAHQTIIHRDLKPLNTLVDNGILKICDFGLAKYVDTATRTQTHKGWGSVAYKSPEAWQLDTNTAAMDIYSLGIMFYQILTLKLPFSGNNPFEFQQQHSFTPLPDITNQRSDIPPRIVSMIGKMTQKRALDRYQNASEIVDVLKDVEQNLEKKNDNEDLLKKINKKVYETEKAQLEQDNRAKAMNTKAQFLEYAFQTLHDKIKTKVDELNASIEGVQIIFKTWDGGRARLSFLNSNIEITFLESGYIEEFLQQRKKDFLESQKQQHGFVTRQIEAHYLEKDNIIAIGTADINSQWGFNLLLRKADETDLYGEWWGAYFDDNPIMVTTDYKTHYSVKPPEFYREYDLGRDPVLHIRKMTLYTNIDEVIKALFEELIESS